MEEPPAFHYASERSFALTEDRIIGSGGLRKTNALGILFLCVILSQLGSQFRQLMEQLTGYTIYLAPPISRWDEDGFTSCSACPCHRAGPTTPPQ
jgi:hypothetical protein